MLQPLPWPAEWLAPAVTPVVARGMADVARGCAAGGPVLLLSPPGAALFAGVGWWRALADQAHARFPGRILADVLDCADAPALALAALRLGQKALILDPSCPAFAHVAAIAAAAGCRLLTPPPRDSGAALR